MNIVNQDLSSENNDQILQSCMVLYFFGEFESDIYNEDKSQMKPIHREFESFLNNSIYVNIAFFPTFCKLNLKSFPKVPNSLMNEKLKLLLEKCNKTDENKELSSSSKEDQKKELSSSHKEDPPKPKTYPKRFINESYIQVTQNFFQLIQLEKHLFTESMEFYDTLNYQYKVILVDSIENAIEIRDYFSQNGFVSEIFFEHSSILSNITINIFKSI